MEGSSNPGGDDEIVSAAAAAARRPSGMGGGGGFLAVDYTDANTHTYVYEPDLSFQQMTLEALPSESNYQPGVGQQKREKRTFRKCYYARTGCPKWMGEGGGG